MPEHEIQMDASIDLLGFLEALKCFIGENMLPEGTPLYLKKVGSPDESGISLHRMSDGTLGAVFSFDSSVLLPEID